jgi:hypothetical protein
MHRFPRRTGVLKPSGLIAYPTEGALRARRVTLVKPGERSNECGNRAFSSSTAPRTALRPSNASRRNRRGRGAKSCRDTIVNRKSAREPPRAPPRGAASETGVDLALCCDCRGRRDGAPRQAGRSARDERAVVTASARHRGGTGGRSATASAPWARRASKQWLRRRRRPYSQRAQLSRAATTATCLARSPTFTTIAGPSPTSPSALAETGCGWCIRDRGTGRSPARLLAPE